ncbi:hypothetical protein PILCRDRAFT_15463 [Piloderma croceum F 1598]|uniref:Uncharacterized protein n=1 Tax=Piloderma croceum (strain F 1598) TaxID=765440 RepID=A0A0C3EKN8_PILCF|nr:hypothetical protein PILCRDRAFT_15463 [Piloderma croceum F 1598]
MPHTVHLSALELLESIGTVKRDKKKDASEGAYQGSVTAPLGREFDNDAVGLDDGNSDDSQDPEVILQEVLLAIEKLCKIIRAVHSSPQRHQAWLTEVTISLHKVENALTHTALMLILNVKTRWSSTHQMLCT